MSTTVTTTPALSGENANSSKESKPPTLAVFMMDLWCIVPYYTTYLYQRLAKQDVEITLGSISYHFDPGHFARSGIANDPGPLDVVGKRRIAWPVLRRGLKLIEALVNMAALGVRFSRRAPDIVHVQYIPLVEEGLRWELRLLELARRKGSKLVYTVHNELPMDTGSRHVQTFRQVYAMMDALICHTRQAKDSVIANYGVAPEKVFVIPHGPMFHDAPRPAPEQARKAAGLEANDVLVLWQGWIKPYKGIEFLLDAWKLVASRAPRAKLLIAGSGDPELLDRIRGRVDALGVMDSVRLDFRFVPAEELPWLYTAADVIVFPYKEITTSGALMTAVSYEKAIVATDLPYFRESVGADSAAELVEYGNEEGFAAALLRMIEDPAHRREMGKMAGRLAQATSSEWDEIARATRRCYEAVLSPESSVRREGVSA